MTTWARHAAVLAVVVGCAAWTPRYGSAQQPDWRSHFASGEEARRAGNNASYAHHMAQAAEAMPPGHLNRPFTQYHAARAHALIGDGSGAIAWLRRAWDEGIESLMITFAEHDPAFDALRDDEGLKEVLGRAAHMELSLTPLSGAVHLVGGAGANVVVSTGPDGVLLVDTGYGAALPALRGATAGLGGGSPSHVVITHPHEDHWGGVAELGADVVVYAHPGTTAAMAEPYTFMEGVDVPPKPPAARPDVEVRDTTFRFNGERVRILPVEAHTGADVAVYFEGSGVLHMGDAYLAQNPMMFPGGEDPDGFLDRLDAFLAGLDPSTVVVGGHDEPTDPVPVRAQIEETRGCMALVRGALDEGLSLEETVRRAGSRFDAPWVGYFYRLFSTP